MSTPSRPAWLRLPGRSRPVETAGAENGADTRTEPPFDPSSWSGALVLMCSAAAVLWVIQIINATQHYRLNRFGLRARELGGLWGVITQPFLHDSYRQMVSDTAPVVIIGWVVMTAGLRVWTFVTVSVILLGDLATWLVAPSGLIVGAGGLVFGWLGYLLARAVFSRRLKWILVAAAVLFFFGALLGNLVPSLNARLSWPTHLCGFLAGVLVGWLLHPRRRTRAKAQVAVPPPVS